MNDNGATFLQATHQLHLYWMNGRMYLDLDDGDSCTMLHIMQLTGCTKSGDCAYNDND